MLQMGEPYTGFRFVSIIPILFLAFFLSFCVIAIGKRKVCNSRFLFNRKARFPYHHRARRSVIAPSTCKWKPSSAIIDSVQFPSYACSPVIRARSFRSLGHFCSAVVVGNQAIAIYFYFYISVRF